MPCFEKCFVLTLHRICGANSDLFGRRWFIISGNVLLFIGFIVGGTVKNNTSIIVASAFIGFVSHVYRLLPKVLETDLSLGCW